MAFDQALANLDLAASWITTEADNNKKKNSQRMDNFKSDILMFCMIYNHHLNQGDFDQHPEIKNRLAKVVNQFNGKVNKKNIKTTDVIESVKALYSDGVLKRKNMNADNSFHQTFDSLNQMSTWLTVNILKDTNTLFSKNKFNQDEITVLLNTVVGKEVDAKALESILLRSNNLDKEQRNAFRHIARSNSEGISSIIHSSRENFSNLQNQLNTITKNPILNAKVRSNLDNIAERNDSAGILKRNFDYYNNSTNRAIAAAALPAESKIINEKYEDSRKLAAKLTSMRTQLEVLGDLEKQLIQEKAKNHPMSTLVRKPSMFSKIKLSDVELEMKDHTQNQGADIEKSLDTIARERYILQNEIRRADKQAVKASKELTSLRREMVESMASPENRNKSTAQLKVFVLLDNTQTELMEKKQLIDLRIHEMKKRGLKDNDKQILQQQELKTSIDAITNMLNYHRTSDSPSITKLQRLDTLLQDDKFKHPALGDVRKSAEKLSSVMKQECKLLDKENTRLRDSIREKNVFTPNKDDRKDGITKSLENVMTANQEMLDELVKQKDFTDDPGKHAERTAKYTHASEILGKISENLLVMEKNPSNTAVARTLRDNIHKYAKDKTLPDSTRKFIGELHGQLSKLDIEQKQKSIKDHAVAPESKKKLQIR